MRAASDVDFEIRRGETLGIVGESGSGKSTLARCIARLDDPSGGSVLLGGHAARPRDDAAARAAGKRVQMVFQDPYRSLNPRLTVAER